MSKGIMEMLREAPVVEYDSRKGITMDELNEAFVKLSNYKTRKPEYILSKWEAENMPLWQLNWLGENYIVLTSLEVANIVTKREKNQS
jgi:hypothetical protein